MRAQVQAPIASAARTYSRARCLRYSARTSRYMPVQPVSAEDQHDGGDALLPSTAAKAKISRMYGDRA